MKKLLFIILALLLIITSCQSTVRVNYMVPSEIDMGQYRNIALASAVPYDGFLRPARYIRTRGPIGYSFPFYYSSSYSYGLKDEIADYATDKIYETLSASGYFHILPPSTTDSILNAGRSTQDILLSRGIDAVIIPKIDSMDVDEYLYTRERTEKRLDSQGKEYEVEVSQIYYDADYYLKLSYTIVDVRTERVIASRSFVAEDDDNLLITGNYISNYPERSFRRMINSMMGRITRQLIPLETSSSIALMDNKPKSTSAERAYEEVSNGNLRYASSLFLSVFEKEAHVPSGYNAALTLAGSGDIEEAIEIAEDVYEKSGNSEVYTLLSRLREYQRSNEETLKQLRGESSSVNISTSYSESIYDALRR